MKKEFKKQKDNIIILTYSAVLLAMGILIMTYPQYGVNDQTYFISMMFFVITFFTVIVYFSTRVKNNYEFLFLAFINVVVAASILLFRGKNASIVLGTEMIVYMLANIGIKAYYMSLHKKKNETVWAIKLITLFLIALIGILTCINLYSQITVITLIFGYYIFSYGVIHMIEPIYLMLLDKKWFKKIFQ